MIMIDIYSNLALFSFFITEMTYDELEIDRGHGDEEFLLEVLEFTT